MGVEVQIYNPSTAEAEEGSSESPEASVIYTVNPRPLRLHTETLSQKTESREKNHQHTQTSRFIKRTLHKTCICFKIYS